MIKKKIIVFCVGYYYDIYHEWLEENYEIVALVDNDKTKWERLYHGYQCVSLEEALARKPEQIIIATLNWNIAKTVSRQIKEASPDMDVIRIGEVAENRVTLKNSEHEKYYVDNLDNEIVFEGSTIFEKINITFLGKKNKVHIGKWTKVDGLANIIFTGDANCLEIGANTTIGSANVSLAERGKVIIGRDCMLSSEIEIHQSASHPIFDLQIGKRLNASRNVRIGNHVWVGQRCGLMSGFSIGDGSVVGFGSVTSGQFGENVVIAGSPARIIREGVHWERDLLRYTLNHVSDSKYGTEVSIW